MTNFQLPASLVSVLTPMLGKRIVATVTADGEFQGDNWGRLHCTPNGLWVAGSGPLVETDLTLESWVSPDNHGNALRITYAEGYETILKVIE